MRIGVSGLPLWAERPRPAARGFIARVQLRRAVRPGDHFSRRVRSLALRNASAIAVSLEVLADFRFSEEDN